MSAILGNLPVISTTLDRLHLLIPSWSQLERTIANVASEVFTCLSIAFEQFYQRSVLVFYACTVLGMALGTIAASCVTLYQLAGANFQMATLRVIAYPLVGFLAGGLEGAAVGIVMGTFFGLLFGLMAIIQHLWQKAHSPHVN